jgi:hypothetical protein
MGVSLSPTPSARKDHSVLLNDGRDLVGDQVPAAGCFDPHRRMAVLAARLFAAVLRLQRHMTDQHGRIAVDAHLDWSCPGFVDT